MRIILTYIAALYFIGGIRVTFSIGVGAGGPAAYWYNISWSTARSLSNLDGWTGQAML